MSKLLLGNVNRLTSIAVFWIYFIITKDEVQKRVLTKMLWKCISDFFFYLILRGIQKVSQINIVQREQMSNISSMMLDVKNTC